jgi:hypothetical protein
MIFLLNTLTFLNETQALARLSGQKWLEKRASA